MSKVNRELLKTIISNQELIMEHLKIKKVSDIKEVPKKTARTAAATKAKSAKKAVNKR